MANPNTLTDHDRVEKGSSDANGSISHEKQLITFSHPIKLNPDSVSFTDLPPEIRNRIYRLALVNGGGINIAKRLYREANWRPKLDKDKFKRMVAQPAITRVSKSIRSETIPVFYGANHFGGYIHRDTDWWRGSELQWAIEWLSSIGPSNRRLIRRLHFRYQKRLTSGPDLNGQIAWMFEEQLKVMGPRVKVREEPRSELVLYTVTLLGFGDENEEK